MSTLTDDQLDQAVAQYLDWRGGRIEGAPDVAGMAARVAVRPAERMRPAPGILVLAVAALLATLLGTAALVGSRMTASDPLLPGTIVIRPLGESAQLALDPLTGRISPLALCGGRCPEALLASWSADGRWMAFLELSGPVGPGSATIRVYDAQTDKVTTVWTCEEPEGCLAGRPVIAPDGLRIAAPLDDQVLTVGVDGADPRVVSPDLGLLNEVSWLADGRVLAYAIGEQPMPDHLVGAVAVDPVSGAAERLPVPRSGGYAIATPDGTRIAVVTMHPFTYFVGPDGIPVLVSDAFLDIWTMAPDGTGVRHLPITGDGRYVHAVFSPDGQSLATVRSPRVTGDPLVLAIVDLATGDVVVERDSPVDVPYLSWSPVSPD